MPLADGDGGGGGGDAHDGREVRKLLKQTK